MTNPATNGERSPSGTTGDPTWRIFRGDGKPRETSFPQPPPWRRFARAENDRDTAHPTPPHYAIGELEIDIINAALHLHRPLLVTGHPGTGKSSLARAIAFELKLGEVLSWPVNSRSTLSEVLYRYDAIGRLHASHLAREAGEEPPDIGQFVRLGPVGTALAAVGRPRVLLIDELDKADVDLPNDLLAILEEGVFEIPELSRLPDNHPPVWVLTADRQLGEPVTDGLVRCAQFPIVIITSNGERDFPPAFRRRCVPLHLADPDEKRLREIITSHLDKTAVDEADDLIRTFLNRRAVGDLATDQLLNAVFLRKGGARLRPGGLLDAVLCQLNTSE